MKPYLRNFILSRLDKWGAIDKALNIEQLEFWQARHEFLAVENAYTQVWNEYGGKHS